eukprot:EG_transcript_25073
MAGEHVRDAPAVAPGKGPSAGKEVGQIFRDYGWGPVQWQYSWSPEGLSECRLELPNEADEDLRERIACIVGMGLDQSQSSRAAAELVLPLLPQPLPRLPLGTVFCPPDVCIVRSTEQAGEMLAEAMHCRWVGVDSECTQVRPPLLVQVATYKRVYVFVAKDRTGVSNPHLAKLFANDSNEHMVDQSQQNKCALCPSSRFFFLEELVQASLSSKEGFPPGKLR